MSDSEEVKFSLRVMISKEKNKVVFAEVDSDFADVLLSFLTLPLGTIMRLMGKHFGDEAPTVGSLKTLYRGLENLDSCYFCTETSKLMLLNARNPFAVQCQKLKVNIDDSEPARYFFCSHHNTYMETHITLNRGEMQCECPERYIREMIPQSKRVQTVCGDVGGFTKETATFLITDDLHILPNSAGHAIQILNSLGIRGTDELKERIFTAGLKEVMDLIKASLISKTPLTDLVLHKRQMVPTTKLSQRSLAPPQIGEEGTSKKIMIKAIIRKSTNKVLIVQAREDFIDFLFNLLVIPLARVVSLLASNTSVGSMDNLYRSVTNLDGELHLKTADLKGLLLKPQIPPEYIRENHIFSITEDIIPLLPNQNNVQFVDPYDRLSYVKELAMFMVTDDLVVRPLSGISSLNLINSLQVPLSDIEELPFEIGTQEALSILQASLTSTSALTDALNPILRRQEKQEN